jgi:hypothetical protein
LRNRIGAPKLHFREHVGGIVEKTRALEPFGDRAPKSKGVFQRVCSTVLATSEIAVA